MSKQYNIRWGRRDYSRLSHLTRKVNKKIFEIEVTRPDIKDYQPQMLDYQEVKKSIKTRSDFNHIMKQYERYLREGSEEIVKSDRGAVDTKWAVNEFNINQRAENRRRAKKKAEIGEKPVTIANKLTGAKRKEMGKIKENETHASKKKFKDKSQQEWEMAKNLFEKKMRSTYNEERKRLYMENYIKGLISEGYPDDVVEMMNKIPLGKFMEIIDLDEVASIDFIYDPIELKIRSDKIRELWAKYVDKNTNNNFDFTSIEKAVSYEYETGQRMRGKGRIKYIRK